MAEAVLGPTLRASPLAYLVVGSLAMIGRRSDFWPCGNYVRWSRSKGPRLIVDMHAEGSRDHDVPVDVGGWVAIGSSLQPTSVVTDP